MNRTLIVCAAFCLTGCATADLPDGFVYETSLRGQQSWHGAGERKSAAADLLSNGVVISPRMALETALPDAEVDLRKWGLNYFGTDWTRYRVVLDVDLRRHGAVIKCRLSEPENVEDAPLLRELEADVGALVQDSLDRLVAACIDEVLNPALP